MYCFLFYMTWQSNHFQNLTVHRLCWDIGCVIESYQHICKQLLSYTDDMYSHAWLWVHVWVPVHFVCIGYWQHTDRMLIIQPAEGWALSGRQVGVRPLRNDETIRQWGGEKERRAYVRAEDDDNELSISGDMNTHYHHQIISSAAPKCDTHGEHIHCSDISTGSSLDSHPFIFFLQQTRCIQSIHIHTEI